MKEKNITTKANISLKTKEGISKTKLKRTQDASQLSAEMLEILPEFEFFSTSHDLAEASNCEGGRGRNRSSAAIQKTARKYKNRGNKAKEYLKTKDMTFLKAANYARLACQFAVI